MLNDDWYKQRDRLIEAFANTGDGVASLEVVRLTREVVQFDPHVIDVFNIFTHGHEINDPRVMGDLARDLLEEEEQARREAMGRGIRQITSALSFLQITGALTAFHMLA